MGAEKKKGATNAPFPVAGGRTYFFFAPFFVAFLAAFFAMVLSLLSRWDLRRLCFRAASRPTGALDPLVKCLSFVAGGALTRDAAPAGSKEQA